MHQRAGRQHHGPLLGQRGGHLGQRPRGTCGAGCRRRSGERPLAPHDALGHARGATRVDEDLVVGAPAPGTPNRSVHRSRDQMVIRDRPGRAVGGVAADPDPEPDLGNVRSHGFNQCGERSVEDHRHRVGVVPEVRQLLRAVAVIGVDRHEAGLEGGEERLHVLRAVVQVVRDLVLQSHAAGQKGGGERVGALVQLGPREAARALHLGWAVAACVGDLLPEVGEGELGHRPRAGIDRVPTPASRPVGPCRPTPPGRDRRRADRRTSSLPPRAWLGGTHSATGPRVARNP